MTWLLSSSCHIRCWRSYLGKGSTAHQIFFLLFMLRLAFNPVTWFFHRSSFRASEMIKSYLPNKGMKPLDQGIKSQAKGIHSEFFPGKANLLTKLLAVQLQREKQNNLCSLRHRPLTSDERAKDGIPPLKWRSPFMPWCEVIHGIPHNLIYVFSFVTCWRAFLLLAFISE